MGPLKALLIAMGHGGNTTHSLHDVEHQALGLQQRLHLALYNHGHVTGLHLGTILDKHFHLHGGVKAAKYLFGNLNTSQNTLLLNQEFRLPHGCFRDTGKGGMVAVANIFSESQVYQPVNQFLFFSHLFYLF